MKKTNRIISMVLAILLAAALLAGGAAAPAAAAEDELTNRMNVVLVIDGSRSLIWEYGATDPNGYRYDAIDLFLALLTENGNHVSTIIFNGKTEFLLDTGFVSLDGRATKLGLSEKIRAVQPDGETNIGAALERAVEEAAAKNAENGLPSVIILFSDGRTDVVKSEKNASIRSKETAVKNAQEKNIPVYTICLAAPNSDADPDELREIAERTNGKFEKVTNAEALSLEFETFYEMIFNTTGAQSKETVFSDAGILTCPLTIPKYGAEEVNVILDTRGLTGIDITGPDASYTMEQVEQISMHGGYYQVIKLVDPTEGDWVIELEGIPKQNVTINVLFNINSSAVLDTVDGRRSYKAGEEVTFCANLVTNGETMLDPSVTSQYAAQLILTNSTTGEELDPISMIPDGQGTFKYTMKTSDCSTYKASVNMVFEDISLASNEITVTFDNTPPIAKQSEIRIEKSVWSPFFGCEETVELSDYFTDDQDDALNYEIVSSQLQSGTYDLDEVTGRLWVNTAECLSGSIVVKALDDQATEASIEVYFDIFDWTFWGWGGIAAVIIVVVVLALVVLAASNLQAWRGDICVANLNGVRAAPRTNIRGSLDLKKFNLGNTDVKGKFKAGAHNQLFFKSKKPIFLENTTHGTKSITLRTGKTKIYADAQHIRGIEVEITPETTRSGGFGSMGSGQKRKPAKNPARKTPGSGF